MIGLPAMAAALHSPDMHLKPTMGLCVRWDAAGAISDVVVVQSSGDAHFDQEAASKLKDLPLQRPASYHGRWYGYTLNVTVTPGNFAPPRCAGYHLPHRKG